MLHLTISFARGGRRDAIVTLAEGLSKAGVTSHLMTLRGDPAEMEPFRDAFERIGMLGVTGLPWPRQVLALRRYCREHAIDILHAHDASSQFVASMLRAIAPKPQAVMTFHRSLGFESAGLRAKIRNGLSLTLVSRVVTASGERRAHFIWENWVSPAKVTTVPLGVDTERFRPDPEARRAIREELGLGDGTHLLVSAGHYGEEKGLDLALPAAAAVVRLRPDLPFRHVVLGTGTPERQRLLERLAAEVGGDRVLLLGQRPDPERWFAAADLVLHTPRLEAFGLVVVQAMACGAPVLASAVGGIPELIDDGETGLLFPPGDHVVMAAQAAALLADDARRSALGQAARAAVVTRFTTGHYADGQLEVYRQMLDGARIR